MSPSDVEPGYLDRHIDAALASALSAAPIVVVDGPRGVGKTTSALRLAGSVVALPGDLDRLDADAEGYLSSLPAPVLIDEWQLAGTGLLWTLKRIVDGEPRPGRFLLAGSTEPATYGPTYPLTGRAVRLVLRPMTVASSTGPGRDGRSSNARSKGRFRRPAAACRPRSPSTCSRDRGSRARG